MRRLLHRTSHTMSAELRPISLTRRVSAGLHILLLRTRRYRGSQHQSERHRYRPTHDPKIPARAGVASARAPPHSLSKDVRSSGVRGLTPMTMLPCFSPLSYSLTRSSGMPAPTSAPMAPPATTPTPARVSAATIGPATSGPKPGTGQGVTQDRVDRSSGYSAISICPPTPKSGGFDHAAVHGGRGRLAVVAGALLSEQEDFVFNVQLGRGHRRRHRPGTSREDPGPGQAAWSGYDPRRAGLWCKREGRAAMLALAVRTTVLQHLFAGHLRARRADSGLYVLFFFRRGQHGWDAEGR
jgi:hypothetical protein